MPIGFLHTRDWQADPYARGAYSFIPVGGLDAPACCPSRLRTAFSSRARRLISTVKTGRFTERWRVAGERLARLFVVLLPSIHFVN
jgi:hypothetical protein